MSRLVPLVLGSALALATSLSLGARAEGPPPAEAGKAPERVTEPCGEGGPELTLVERAEKERQKHTARVTKLERLEQVATEAKNDALLASVARMRDKESARHERVLARLEAAQAQRDQKVERREDRREERQERRDERRDERAGSTGKGKKAKDPAASR